MVVILRKHAPPEAARLLPGADGFAYIDLQWMRRANILGELPPVQHDPDYEQFIQATGFNFESDLEQAAVAIHYPNEGISAGLEGARFSYVFVAKIDGERLRNYLTKVAGSVEDYHSVEIYSIPLEGRTLRLAILGVDTVAASNHSDPQVIEGIVDRSRKLASPFGGPLLLRQYYKEVPLASLAWAIFRVQPSNGFFATPPGQMSWSFLFPRPAVVVGSIRYLRALHFRAEAFAGTQDDAQKIAENLGTFLNLFHVAESSVSAPGPDPDVKAFFDSLKVEHEKQRAIVTATAPTALMRKLLEESPTMEIPQPAPAPTPTPAQKPRAGGEKRKRK